MAEWIWDQRTRVYHRLDGEKSLSENAVRELRREFTAVLGEHAAGLAQSLGAGKITVDAWEGAMLRLVRSSYLAQGLLGRGGIQAAPPAEVARWQSRLAEQQRYLADWAAELRRQSQPVSIEGITARARLYFGAGNAVFEEAKAAGIGIPGLPQYPADGSQECLSNCQCSWSIQATDTSWECTWELEPGARHCETCTANAEQWSPLVIDRTAEEPTTESTRPLLELLAPANGKH